MRQGILILNTEPSARSPYIEAIARLLGILKVVEGKTRNERTHGDRSMTSDRFFTGDFVRYHWELNGSMAGRLMDKHPNSSDLTCKWSV